MKVVVVLEHENRDGFADVVIGVCKTEKLAQDVIAEAREEAIKAEKVVDDEDDSGNACDIWWSTEEWEVQS